MAHGTARTAGAVNWHMRLIRVPIILLGLLACSNHPERSSPKATAQPVKSVANVVAPAAQKVPEPMPEPTTLLTRSGSAYAFTLAIDDEANYLLMDNAAYRVVPGRDPERQRLDLGISPVLMNDYILYWTGGAFRQVHKRRSEPSVLAAIPHQPQRVATSGDHFAWLDQADSGRFTIQTLRRLRARVLLAPRGTIAALAMSEKFVYFVEQGQGPGAGWRLGAVPISGGSPRYTSMKTGRTPAMLVVANDLFYYDGPSLTVRRVTKDLEREEVVARDIICSPLAVTENVYCAQIGGILEVGLDGVVRRVFPLRQRGTITAVAATATRLTWLMDIGGGDLAVQTIHIN
jgi:hypothetical protein